VTKEELERSLPGLAPEHGNQTIEFVNLSPRDYFKTFIDVDCEYGYDKFFTDRKENNISITGWEELTPEQQVEKVWGDLKIQK
jgi:hypothetical protein